MSYSENTSNGKTPEECLLSTKDLKGGRRALGQICETASMRNQTSPNHFTNQGSQIGSNIIHFSNKIFMELLPVLGEVHYPLSKLLDINQVYGGQVLPWKRER